MISDAYPRCVPAIDLNAPLLFVINGAAGQHDPGSTRQLIEAALRTSGRTGVLLFARPHELTQIAHQAALRATAQHSAMVAVGGDGTINTVAQAAHWCGCAMGVLPQGTFNYFARAHGIPTDAAQAVQALLQWHPVPVQLGLINEHVFLVNASLGLYPQLLQEREANKSRFGPGRLVALASALVTWLGPHRLLHLHIERGESVRDVKTAMLFIGNNRLQLDQVGWPQARALDQGYMAAVMLRPMGTLAMLWLLLRGSVGQLGDASAVESFTFHRLVVKPRLAWGHRGIKVAFDGEVCHMRAPLEFRISPKPLYLLKQTAQAPSSLDTQGCA